MKITKKKIVLGFLAFECLSLPLAIPATAQIVDKVFFSVSPRAAFAAINHEAGQTSFIVASNAPFSLIASNMVGEIKVDIQVNGEINGNTFGTAAQDPGFPEHCVIQTRTTPTTIYKSFRKTAERRGNVIDQAVLITLKYDESAKPKFDIQPSEFEDAQSAAPLQPCAHSEA